MKENANRQAGLISAYSEIRKRKSLDEQLEMPFPKQGCRDHHLDRDKLAKVGYESEPESSTNSNSCHNNFAHCNMSCDDDEDNKTDSEIQKTCTSNEASTSSASWAGTLSDASLYSSENRFSFHSSTSEEESSLSISKHQDCPDDQCGHAEIDRCTDKELENLLYSNGVTLGGSSYVLSSGRWSAHQEGKKKLTIDKEFEQHFSMLMM